MKPYNPTVCTCIIRLSHATANFMQLVLGNWANFQLHVSHATENQLHKTVAKCQISSSETESMHRIAHQVKILQPIFICIFKINITAYTV